MKSAAHSSSLFEASGSCFGRVALLGMHEIKDDISASAALIYIDCDHLSVVHYESEIVIEV